MKWILYAGVALTLMGAYASGVLFFLTHIAWVDLSVLEHYSPGKPSILLDDEGNEWARFHMDRRSSVALSSMPKHLIDAFLAAEDRHFFRHRGISFQGIVRSIVINLVRGRRVQGASTITQQLVRLLFFDQKKTFRRKIKEQLLSLTVERQFTKELILETYLNNLYFGCGIYGVQSASRRFWGKDVDELTGDESATLAAIIPSPARYCPLINPEHTRTRRNYILKLMHASGTLSATAYSEFRNKPVVVKLQPDEHAGCAPHAKEHVRAFVEGIVDRKELYSGGLTIQTTLRAKMQRQAEKTFTQHIKKLRSKLGDDVDGAMVTVSAKNGSIKAMVGGYDFAASQFNRAVHAGRQLGSVFKPLIYSVALQESGLDFDTIATDEPVMISELNRTWTPRNANGKFEGRMTLAQALACSKNTIAIKVLLRTGISTVIGYANKMSLARVIEPYPSLALGCIDTSALRAASLFAMLAHKGIFTEPYLIDWVKDRWGKKIWKHKDLHEPVLSWATTSKVCQVLSACFDKYTHKGSRVKLGVPAFGKTGTTNQSRTCWFAGSTPSWTTVVYVGRDNNQPLGNNIYARRTAMPLWFDFNRAIEQPISSFSFDPSLSPHWINPVTGQPVATEETTAQVGQKQAPFCILANQERGALPLHRATKIL